jgi:hypothetical protein
MRIGGVEVNLHAFLTSVLDGGEWSTSHTGHSTPRERSPGNRWIGGSVSCRAGLGRDGEEKDSHPLPGLEPPIIQPVAQRYTTELKCVCMYVYMYVYMCVCMYI